MKTAIALLVMMVGVVGWGQTTATKTVPAHVVWSRNGSYMCVGDEGFCRTPTEAEIAAHKPKPRVKKSKTVKPTVSPKPILGDETDGERAKAGPVPLNLWSANTHQAETLDGIQVKNPDVLWFDGWAVNTSAAGNIIWEFGQNHSVTISHVGRNYSMNDDSTVSVTSATGRIDRLSNEEYKELQDLSKQIALLRAKQEMAKIRIAKAHGVEVMPELRPCPPDCFTTGDIKLYEHWEIHGQFLEVNVPTEAK